MPAKLTIARGPEKGREIILEENTIQVGRDQACDVVLSDARTSRYHASLHAHGDTVELIDLDSRNGTRVNGRLISHRELKHGDVIKIGGMLFQFSSRQQPPVTVARKASADEKTPVKFDTLKMIEGTLRDFETVTGGNPGRQLAILYRSGHILSGLHDPTEILNRTLDLVFEALPAIQHGSIHMLDEQHYHLVCVSSRHAGPAGANLELPYSRTFLDMALQDKQALLIEDVLSDARFDTQSSIRQLNVQAAMCAPLQNRNAILGLLHVSTPRGGPSLSVTDLQCLAGMGLQAGAALSQAHLIENLEREKTALQQTRDMLGESEKMAAVGRLAAGVVHDIKAPLTVITGFMEMLKAKLREAPLSPDARGEADHFLENINRGVEQCTQVIANLLDFAQPGRTHLRATRPDDLMQETLDLLKVELGRRGTRLEQHFEADLPAVLLDPVQVKRVFVNLIMNALQAMEETRGRLLVTMCREAMEEKPMIAIRVSDNGCGMPETVRRQVFEPFFSTRDSTAASGGSGLGLSICYGIVSAHGGHLEVDSTEGIGTTFTLWLPETGGTPGTGDATLAD